MKKQSSCSGNPFAEGGAGWGARSSSRREFLHVGVLAGLGLTLPEFLKMQAHGAQKHYESKEGVAKSVIQIFLPGGMAQQESFDPKPYAPSIGDHLAR
jgi:hypothetical protein